MSTIIRLRITTSVRLLDKAGRSSFTNTSGIFGLIYQFWIHTQHIDKLPKVIEFFFNTPSHHRVHHAKNIKYLDRNHAGILIIWDGLFGTFQVEDPAEPVVYGITTNINTYNPLRIATHDFVNIWKDLKRAPN